MNAFKLSEEIMRTLYSLPVSHIPDAEHLLYEAVSLARMVDETWLVSQVTNAGTVVLAHGLEVLRTWKRMADGGMFQDDIRYAVKDILFPVPGSEGADEGDGPSSAGKDIP